MKIRQLFMALALSVFAFGANAKTTTTSVSVTTALSSPVVLTDSTEKNYLKIALNGADIDKRKRVPLNLALVIDRSSSMHGERIERAREAAVMAINMLNENDTLSVIAYDSDATVVIPATKVTDKKEMINIINQQFNMPTGMTALFAGLSKGINQVDQSIDKEKVNRVILISDGQANIGPTSVNELSELAIIAAKKGIAITTIGIGHDYNERLMTNIASYSDGNHAFVSQSSDLETVFVHEFDDVMSVVAQEIVITIKLNEGVKAVRLLGRNGTIKGNEVKVKMNQLYANQEKYVLLELLPEQGNINEQKNLASISIDYDDLMRKKTINHESSIGIQYTNNKEVVAKSMVDDVVAESEIQKVAIKNKEALALYDKGEIAAAKAILQENSDQLSELTHQVSSSSAAYRLQEQAEKNQIMAKSIDVDNAKVYSKKAAKMQFDVESNSIKHK